MGKRLQTWEEFSKEISVREDTLSALLPPDMPKDLFVATAITAVQQRPELLEATPRTLFGAISKSAKDGIAPDGRDGVILNFNTRVKVKRPDGSTRWEKENQAMWLPMVPGVRKRSRKLDNIIVTAEVVYENDQFDLAYGDEPTLTHRPPQLGQERGKAIGAYAIYRLDGEILHREIMSAEQIERVRATSRNPDGLLWKDFWEEGWRKTVIRRGFKSVPVGADLERIIRRDDVMYDFVGEATDVTGQQPKALPPEASRTRTRPRAQREPAKVVTGTAKGKLPPPVRAESKPENGSDASPPNADDADEWRRQYDDAPDEPPAEVAE